ncbi:MAG TPA: hypothetical protein VNZ45_16590 [Bacteroidia bacterium]|nr:hypothetical protein [Bacteroidia bacterium]
MAAETAFNTSYPGNCASSLSSLQAADAANVNTNCLTCTACANAAATAGILPSDPNYQSYVQNCENEGNCGALPPSNHCESLLNNLIADMSPGGQYADDVPAGSGNPPNPGAWFVNNNMDNFDPYSIPCAQSQIGADYGAGLAGFKSWLVNGHCVPNNAANINSWADVFAPANWQSCFAEHYLVFFHPEYCRYCMCQTLNNSNTFDQTLAQNSTYNYATTTPNGSPYINFSDPYPGYTLLQDDPFFAPPSPGPQGPGYPTYYNMMAAQLQNYNSLSLTLWQYANTESNTPNGGNCTNCDATWQFFMSAYSELKQQYIHDYEATQGCLPLCDAGVQSQPNYTGTPTDVAGGSSVSNGCNAAADAAGFYIRDPDNFVQTNALIVSMQNANNSNSNNMNSDGGGSFGQNAQNTYDVCNTPAKAVYPINEMWANTNSTNPNLNPGDSAQIHVWIKTPNIDLTQQTALFTVQIPTNYTAVQFATALASYVNNGPNKALGYFAKITPNGGDPLFEIDAPVSLSNTPSNNNWSVIVSGDLQTSTPNNIIAPIPATKGYTFVFSGGGTVACTSLLPTQDCFCGELQLLHKEYSGDFSQMASSFNTTYNLSGPNMVTALQVQTWYSNCFPPNALPGQNNETGDPSNNGADPVPMAINCDNAPPCWEDSYDISNFNAGLQYNQTQTQNYQNFVNAYKTAAFTNPTYSEDLSVNYINQEYHYTLYFYDLAGNLARTVPPDGVHLFSQGDVTTIEANRNYPPGQIFVNPPLPGTQLDLKIAQYQYNSINELVYESTPDAKVTTHYYDIVGRLRFSQNAKQAVTPYPGFPIPGAYSGYYSYTKYDAQGRITEVGENYVPDGVVAFYNGVNDETFPNILSSDQVTQTYYDNEFPGITPTLRAQFDNGGQQFLRSRIATTTFEAIGTNNPAIYDYATHYSYDEHGNVSNLIQENPSLALFNNPSATPPVYQQYKKLSYDYDLVSGNVNMCTYQPDQVDQFIHRYEYDADNRITNAFTSTDGVIWDQDCKYFYYLHGSMARGELGQEKVQGMDYAYAINGWLKGVNSNVLDEPTDIGYDGMGANDQTYSVSKGIHNNMARDAYGFTLNYFTNDYTAINSALNGANSFYQNGLNNNPNVDLFNGNIKQYAVALTNTNNNPLPLIDNEYLYDQLNRISYNTPLTGSALTAYTGFTNQSHYTSQYKYDPEGNISLLSRNDGSANTIDNIAYTYANPGVDNKLDFVTQTGTHPATSIQPGQGAGNYGYDQIGELTSDVQSGITSSNWSVYHKILSITRTTGIVSAGLDDMEFAYDAHGNRIMKISKPRDANGNPTNQDKWTYTYYVYDASGNIMATYNRAFSTAAVSSAQTQTLTLAENPIYGGKRIGDFNRMIRGTAGLVPINVAAINYILTGYTNNLVTYSGNPNNQAISSPYPSVILAGDRYLQRDLGFKNYELTDHLGNVLDVVSDRKVSHPNGLGTGVLYYTADVMQNNDYYPF